MKIVGMVVVMLNTKPSFDIVILNLHLEFVVTLVVAVRVMFLKLKLKLVFAEKFMVTMTRATKLILMMAMRILLRCL